LHKGTENKYEGPFSGPHKILKVNTNGTVRLRVGSVTDTVNIRRIEPYKEVSDSIHGGECNMRLSKKRRQSRLSWSTWPWWGNFTKFEKNVARKQSTRIKLRRLLAIILLVRLVP
jgi:hypothetical protein